MGNQPARLLAWLDSGVRVIGALLLALMAGIVLLQVLGRYFLRISIAWPEEASRFLLIWVTFLGAVLGARHGSHYAVTILSDLAPPGLRRIIGVVVNLVACLALALLFWQGLRLVQTTANQTSPALQFSMGLVFAVIPLSATLMFVHFALAIVNTIAGRRTDV